MNPYSNTSVRLVIRSGGNTPAGSEAEANNLATRVCQRSNPELFLGHSEAFSPRLQVFPPNARFLLAESAFFPPVLRAYSPGFEAFVGMRPSPYDATSTVV